MIYDRAALVDTVVYHWRTDSAGCGCGWAVLGASHAEHVADVHEHGPACHPNCPTCGGTK